MLSIVNWMFAKIQTMQDIQMYYIYSSRIVCGSWIQWVLYR